MVKVGDTLENYSQDEKWNKAKRLVKESSGDLNIILAVSCYHALEGKNVFVYAVTDNGMDLIIDLVDDDHVLVVSQDKVMHISDYDSVFKARKIMHYNTDSELVKVQLDKDCQALIEETDMEVIMEGGN